MLQLCRNAYEISHTSSAQNTWKKNSNCYLQVKYTFNKIYTALIPKILIVCNSERSSHNSTNGNFMLGIKWML